MKWLRKFDFAPKRSIMLCWVGYLLGVCYLFFILSQYNPFWTILTISVFLLFVSEIIADWFDQNHFLRKTVKENNNESGNA